MSGHTEALATAAHLHVLLRRKTGRITDTEWMASNPEYARAIVAFARDTSNGGDLAELQPWADKLEGLIPAMGIRTRKPLLAEAAERLKPRSLEGATGERSAPGGRISGFLEPSLGSDAAAPSDRRYVGGIR
ncbi:hypothetical protein [Hydrogenophaga crassostreae]|nr:hypothetical protein [Hydrogenophaga crassostreae]